MAKYGGILDTIIYLYEKVRAYLALRTYNNYHGA